MNELLCLLPGLHLPDEYHSVLSEKEWPLPSLNAFLRFGKRSENPQQHSDLLTPLFSGSLKAAVLRDLDLPENTPAFFASLISQKMDMHTMRVVSGQSLGLSLAESEDLCQAINALMRENDWQCHIYRPDLWLVTLPETREWNAQSIWNVSGRLDNSNTIYGEDAAVMLKILTEWQMLLYSLPLNRKRQEFAQLPINGAWFWQDITGSLQAPTLLAGNVDWLPENPENITIGLPEDWESLRAQWQLQPQCARACLYLNQAQDAQNYGDMAGFHDTLCDWEEFFFAPLYQDWQQGHIETIRLISQTATITLKKGQHRHFWKNKKQYCGQW